MIDLELNYWLLTPIVLLTFFILILAFVSRKFIQDRIIITVFSVGFLLYSGIGIAYNQADYIFVIPYIMFYLLFITFFCVFSGNSSVNSSNIILKDNYMKLGIIDRIF
ncbi:hypothetical protein V7122_09550, partial [Bacillus sp. JJ1532]|uniref:hypothetical protein n=1 Tax=Bacillus sp. JJ1532 TaxID=3122958 RepID=UPI002FFE81F0